MAAARTQTDVLLRVRREQRMRGKDSSFSGVRIVLFAAGITVAILFFAFGAIGMLMMARSPQEPIASKLDPAPPIVQQTEVPAPIPQAEVDPLPLSPELLPDEKKTVKTLRVVAPPAPVTEQNDAVAQQPQVPEPETTAAIPPAAEQRPEVPPPVAQQRRRYPQQAVRGPVVKRDSQSDNPLFQLFGIKQYR
jgi:hypothetical protein